MGEKRYRDNVCAAVRRDSDGRFLLCHRIDSGNKKEGWQFPQGGADLSLGVEREVKRELLEEIGTDRVFIERFSDRFYYYDFPAPVEKGGVVYAGQRQLWALATFINVGEVLINTGSVYSDRPEFDDFRWVTPEAAVEEVVYFKKQVYKDALTDLGVLIRDRGIS